MSVDLSLTCTTCKESLWVGQGMHIYTAKEYLDALQTFLFKHHTYPDGKHLLIFVDEHYVSVEPVTSSLSMKNALKEALTQLDSDYAEQRSGSRFAHLWKAYEEGE